MKLADGYHSWPPNCMAGLCIQASIHPGQHSGLCNRNATATQAGRRAAAAGLGGAVTLQPHLPSAAGVLLAHRRRGGSSVGVTTVRASEFEQGDSGGPVRGNLWTIWTTRTDCSNSPSSYYFPFEFAGAYGTYNS